MTRRVDIKKTLKDPAKRRRLLASALRFLAATEGRDLTWKDAYEIVDRGRK